MKYSIIIRAFNRLEYTIQCLNRVMKATKTNPDDYEIILVDNASKDGTYERVQRVHAHTNWFKIDNYIQLDTNIGDWNGLLEGYKYAKGDYVIQLDSDILVPEMNFYAVPSADWLYVMSFLIEGGRYKSVMYRRIGVNKYLVPLDTMKILDIQGQLIEHCTVERPVACFMTTREIMEQMKDHHDGNTSKGEIACACGGKVGKIWNYTCEEIEGRDGGKYLQHDKYVRKEMGGFI